MSRIALLTQSVVVLCLYVCVSGFANGHTHTITSLNSQDIRSQYKNVSELIFKSVMSNGNLETLEYLVDTFGPRYCGTPNLENAIDWVLKEMGNQGLENVQGETVPGITNWVRGQESLVMTQPRQHTMALLGLGRSIGTPKNGITAEVLVVSSFDDLTANASKAKGKIVVFNAPFVTYGQTVAYRAGGADAASKVGGVAALVRSITPYSLYTPHTGAMDYSGNVPPIPTAAITVEDSEMMSRMQKRGQKIVVTLYMEAQNLGNNVTSRNILAEVKGREFPNEIVLFGGHIDSWDVGQGAMDDGAGFFSAWEALRVIHSLVNAKLIPRPRRTLRAIGWVNEEMGSRGATVYLQNHNVSDHVLAIESDSGNFHVLGFGFTGLPAAQSIVTDIAGLLDPISASQIFPGAGADTDNGPLVAMGVPGMSLQSTGFGSGDNAFYFNYHHSNADTITALDYDGVKKSIASMAVMTYVVADIEQRLPANYTKS